MSRLADEISAQPAALQRLLDEERPNALAVGARLRGTSGVLLAYVLARDRGADPDDPAGIGKVTRTR